MSENIESSLKLLRKKHALHAAQGSNNAISQGNNKFDCKLKDRL
jgi:hypothetical protein